MYDIIVSPEAWADLLKLQRSEPKAFKKAERLIDELRVHPKIGTGHSEPLKGDRAGQWSRRISDKHRLVYEIFEREVYVEVITSYGHYGDR